MLKILVVGAGALGGYFGGRLLEAGQDVTFLLRPGRAKQLAQTGLVIKSTFGELKLPNPPHVLSSDLKQAFDLEQTMESFAPAVGPGTSILPLLNGMRHLDQLDARFGADKVLGGMCLISAALDANGAIVHFNDLHNLVFGERAGGTSARVEAIAQCFGKARFQGRASTEIAQEMWEKWVFIAAAAGSTCLMRAAIGDIVSAQGADLPAAIFRECIAIGQQNGFAPRQAVIDRSLGALSAAGSPITASMLKDLERGAPVEADQIIGDMLARSTAPIAPASLLRIAYIHLKSYEARRARMAASPG